VHGALKFRFAHFNQVPSSCSPLQSCEPRRPFTEYHAVRLSTWTGGCVSMETENADHPAVTSTLYTTAATPLPSPRLSLPCPSVCVCVWVFISSCHVVRGMTKTAETVRHCILPLPTRVSVCMLLLSAPDVFTSLYKVLTFAFKIQSL